MNTSLFSSVRKVLIGVVHLQPLPGSARWTGSLKEVIEAAVRDALAYEEGGAQALCIENFGDVPFAKANVGPETVAAMATAGQAIGVAVKLPFGFNVLRNDPRSALALCAACDGRFIRVNVHTGAMLTDQGIIEGDARSTLIYRRQIAPNAQIWADIHVKHAVPLGNWGIGDSARDALERGLADALIVSGVGTGLPTNVDDLNAVRSSCPSAKVLLGSGVTVGNVAQYLELADGFIVGTSLKRDGRVSSPVDTRRVSALARRLRQFAG